jgi:N-acetylmuramoyl-L-alanine amidase
MPAFSPAIRYRPLSYVERLSGRSADDISCVVIHATELPDLDTAREFGEEIHHTASQTGNSGHFYIDLDGTVEQWVPLERVAHHVRGHNANSIGIELVHRGRWPDWFDSGHQDWKDWYPDTQIQALVELLQALRSELPALMYIAGHDELDTDMIPASDDPSIMIRRKLDPGPTFPWPSVLQAIPLVRLPGDKAKGEKKDLTTETQRSQR